MAQGRLKELTILHHIIESAVKTVGFVSGKMSYVALRGRLCDIVVFNTQHTN